MDLLRIRRELEDACLHFEYVQLNPTTDGKVFAKVALQAGNSTYISAIYFPDSYPYQMPKVYISKPTISNSAPHQYSQGNICYLHPNMWNPGRHDLKFVIIRTAKWLSKYEVWKLRGRWAGAEIKH